MSNAAVAQGDYVQIRFVKTRSVASIEIEIPIEQAAAFIAAFGCPSPANGVPVALARLDQTVVEPLPPAPKEKRNWKDLMPSQQAALRCNEKGFWKFLDEGYLQENVEPESAAEFVRAFCGVKSRSELDVGGEGYHKWRTLENAYHNWQRGWE